MPLQTKIFRIFVSSTFNDMRTERKLLREKVFTVLEQFCRENGARFQAIDLRWGVSEESQRNQKTMEICLNEIRRCQKLSPRPNFLILLGDRYGWQPAPLTIPQTEMDSIYPHLTLGSQKLVDDWYCLDENAVPAEYILQPWGERIKEYQEWEPIEYQLRMAFREATQKTKLSGEALVKFTTSATHQEILAGALNPPPDAAAPESHVLAFSRTIDNLPHDDQARDYLDLVQGKPDPYSRSQLKKLHGDLEAKLKDHYIKYQAIWVQGEIKLEDEQKFIDQTIGHLKSVIESELAKIVEEDEIKQEMRYHEEFAKSWTTFFTGRQDTLDRIREYLDNKNMKQSLSLIGVSGSGKTCVMAKAILEAQNRNAVLVYRFIGANAKSSKIVPLLTNICGQIAEEYGTNLESLLDDAQKGQHFEIDLLTDLFRKCFVLAKPDKPLILFLDALDQLSDMDNARFLSWLPRELPPDTYLIVSCLPELEGILNDTDIYHLPLMPKVDGEKLLQTWLSAHRRRLTDAQKKEVLSQFDKNGLPLYLKIAFEQTGKWRSYSKLVNLSDNVPSMIEQFLSGLETDHSQALVSKVVGYILSGKDKGLTEDEILDMLVFDEEYWQYFLRQSHPSYRKEVEDAKKLPAVIWSRLFLDLAPYLTERDSYGERILGFYHRQFNEILNQKYIQEKMRIHRKLGEYFNTTPNFFDGDKQKQPNVRKCVEQPWQQTQGEMWDEVTDTLCNFEFIQANAVAKMTYELARNFNDVLELIPDNREHIRNEKEMHNRMEKYTKDLITYAKGETTVLEIPESIVPWSEVRTDAEIDKMKTNPTRIYRLIDFENFIGQEASNLQNYADKYSHFALQQAWNFTDQGPVGKAAENGTTEVYKSLLLRHQTTRPHWNPMPQVLRVLKGHNSAVLAVAIIPNGRRAISGAQDQPCILWDLETGEAIKILNWDTDQVRAVSITPDGQRAICTYGASCILWDLNTGQVLQSLDGDGYCVETVSITPDGKQAISGSIHHTFILWDLHSGKPIKSFKGQPAWIHRLAVSITPDAKQAISGSSEQDCILWDLTRGVATKTLKGHIRCINAVSITPDGQRAISASDDKTCILWDLATGRALKTLKGHTGDVTAVSITPDGRLAISGSTDRTCILWDLITGEALETFKGHTDQVLTISITPDGKRAISGSSDHSCILWNLISGKMLKNPNGHTDSVIAVSVSPEGQRALSASRDETCILWELKTGKAIQILKGHAGSINTVSFTPDGQRAISASYDRYCILWDLETGEALQTLKGHTDYVTTVSITPDGQRAISGSKDNTCILWDLATGEALKFLKGHTKFITGIYITPDGRKAISRSFNSICIIWDLNKGEALQTLDELTDVAITSDGKRAIARKRNGTCIQWNLITGEVQPIPATYTYTWKKVTVSPDAQRVIYVSDDKTCIIKNLETGEKIGQFVSSSDINAISWFPGGIFGGESSGKIFIISCSKELLCPKRSIVTIRRIWDFKLQQSLNPVVDCPGCGRRSAPAASIMAHIAKITKKARLKPEQSPYLELPKEAFEEPGLLDNCPKCGEALKFNPFVAGGDD